MYFEHYFRLKKGQKLQLNESDSGRKHKNKNGRFWSFLIITGLFWPFFFNINQLLKDALSHALSRSYFLSRCSVHAIVHTIMCPVWMTSSRLMISVDEISRQVADLCPEDHLKAFLKRDTRPDGRSLEEFRPIIIAPNVLNRFVGSESWTSDRNFNLKLWQFVFGEIRGNKSNVWYQSGVG